MFAKALFFGGVTARFPDLKFAFLEGGVAWGGVLLQGLVGRWEKRNAGAIEQFNSANVDLSLMREMFDQYAGNIISRHISGADSVDPPPRDVGLGPGDRANPAMLDDFASCGVHRAEDIADIFTRSFYFGCEADDPYAGAAVRREAMPFDARLNAMFSSDIGHWDVVDARDVVAESYELFEDGLVDEYQYRDFMFGNAVRLHAGMNPDFFKGTIVEDDVTGPLEAEPENTPTNVE
jgi:hypothetical protein